MPIIGLKEGADDESASLGAHLPQPLTPELIVPCISKVLLSSSFRSWCQLPFANYPKP
jgi:hypothetical protein